MRNTKLVLAAALALIALSAAASTATAASFSIAPGGPITKRSLGLMTWSSSIIRVTCLVALEGTINRELINKITGTVFGRIERATVETCNGEGRAIIQEASLPWDFQYDHIEGVLPDGVTGILKRITNRGAVPGAGFIVEAFGTRCLFRGPINALAPLVRVAGGGGAPAVYTMGLLRIGLNSSALFEGGMLCPRNMLIFGTFSTTPAQRFIRSVG